MPKARKESLLVVALPDRVGLLADLGGMLGGAGVNIQAVCGYRSGQNAEFLLLVDNPGKARKALEPLGSPIREEDVATVELANKPGQLAAAARKLADAGLSIEYSWSVAVSGSKATWIFRTAEIIKAVDALNR
jgi:hypothetical protein